MHQTYAHPLNVSDTFHSRYKMNSTVKELVNRVFIEKWLTKLYYDRYIAKCAPNICTYSHINSADPLYVVNTLLGWYGGLTVILSWWCPRIVKLVRRIQIYYKTNRQIRATFVIT